MDNCIDLELNKEALKKILNLDLLDYLRNTLDEIDPCLVQGQRAIRAMKKLVACFPLLDEIEIRLAQGQRAIEAMKKLVVYLPSLNDCRLTGEEQAELAYTIGGTSTWKR